MSDPHRTTNESPGPAPLRRRQWAMLVTLTSASFVVIMNAAALPIPLPSIMEDLGGTLDEVTWVLGAFVVVFAVMLLPCARLGDIYGRRLLFVSGTAVFTQASLACALAPSIEFLIGAQAVLGMGAAMMEPAVFAIIKATFPPERQGRAFGVQAAGFFAGGALGPVLSGAVTTGLSWEYIFGLNALVGAAVLAATPLAVPASRAEGGTAQFDAPGLLLSATGVVFLVFAIVEGARLGWSTPVIVGSFAASAVLLVLFVGAQLRVREPLVDPGLFKDRLFAVGNLLRAITEFASLGIFFALSHFLQVQLGYSALVTGALLMTVIVAALVTAPLAEALTGRVDVRWLVVPGFVLAAAGTFWVAHVSPDTGWAFFVAPLAIFGAGVGALESPVDTTTRADVPVAESDVAWRVSYSTYLLGIVFGVAVVAAVWQSRLVASAEGTLARGGLPATVGNAGAYAAAVNTALLCCAAAALLGAAIGMFFSSNRKEAAGAAGGVRSRPATS